MKSTSCCRERSSLPLQQDVNLYFDQSETVAFSPDWRAYSMVTGSPKLNFWVMLAPPSDNSLSTEIIIIITKVTHGNHTFALVFRSIHIKSPFGNPEMTPLNLMPKRSPINSTCLYFYRSYRSAPRRFVPFQNYGRTTLRISFPVPYVLLPEKGEQTMNHHIRKTADRGGKVSIRQMPDHSGQYCEGITAFVARKDTVSPDFVLLFFMSSTQYWLPLWFAFDYYTTLPHLSAVFLGCDGSSSAHPLSGRRTYGICGKRKHEELCDHSSEWNKIAANAERFCKNTNK